VMTKIVVWTFILGVPLTAHAQKDADDEQGKQTAAEQFARGKELFAAGKYSESAVAFTEAYEAAPHQAVLANIALCYDKAGRYPEAVIYYRRYIEDPVDKGKNAEIRKRLQELKNEIGEFDIECAAPGCSILIDGEELGVAPVNAVVEPGSHKIEAVVDGEVREAVMERADGGTVVRVRLRANEGEDAALSVAPDTGGKTIPEDSEISLGVPFWIASGVTVAAGATTVVFGVRTLKARDDYEASEYTDKDLKDQGERDRLITNIMIGVTAAAGVAAVAFAIHDVFFADDEEAPADDSESEADPDVAIVPGPGVGLGLAGTF
ncbi:MAG: PEGA domain-containing protein, partial [Deltaproteobacteria bacterium]|nr:PEGA domain-containing protein [Deltaproteobacteria bacterium]